MKQLYAFIKEFNLEGNVQYRDTSTDEVLTPDEFKKFRSSNPGKIIVYVKED